MPPPTQPTLFDRPDDSPPPDQEAAKEIKPGGMVSFALALLALGNVKGIGFKGLKKLVGVLKDQLPELLECPRDNVLELLERCKINGAAKLADEIASKTEGLIQQGESAFKELACRGIMVIPPSALPTRFQEIKPDPPYWLFVEGRAELLNTRPTVAVVGTRKPTADGLRAASIVAQVLAPYPIVLVSGLAEGIDEEAHNTSLNEGVKNVAFLGHGVNFAFPEKTVELRQRIVRDGGAAVSEYLPHEHPAKHYFVQRNRLQAALADIVIPVEARPEGGTAHTIRFAKQYQRRVIGIRWPGANGIVAEFEREGDTVIDIRTQAGCRQLDGIFRRLVEESGKQAYSLSKIEQRLFSEIRSRDTRQEDIARLIGNLQNLLKEPPSNGSPEGRDLRR